MTLDELKIPFKWYQNEAQTSRKNSACSNYRYKLITPEDRLLPFIIRFVVSAEISLPVKWTIYNADTNATINIAQTTAANLLEYYKVDKYAYIVYKGQQIQALNLPHGYFYSIIELQNGTKFYSEEFWVDCDPEGRMMRSADFGEDYNEDFGPVEQLGGVQKYTKLQWWNNCDLGPILYQTGYQNVLYIDSDIILADPKFEEEGNEDGNKNFIVTFAKHTDVITLQDYVPSHILNALLAIRVHSNAIVTTKGSLYVGLAKRFECSPTPHTMCHSTVNIKFERETTLFRSQCCRNMTLEDIYACNGELKLIDYGFTNFIGSNFINRKFFAEWEYEGGTPAYYIVESPMINDGAPLHVTTTRVEGTDPVIPNISRSFTIKAVCILPNNKVAYSNVITGSAKWTL